MFGGLIDDTMKLHPNPRKFTSKLPIIETLGIENYDEIDKIISLQVKMREALSKFQKLWQTLDKDKIHYIIRLCLTRELQ